MATYCVSDIHGDHDKYFRILKEISFSEDDTLFVLGDVVDRGPQSMEVLLDMMGRPNVIPIVGNHEFMAARCLRDLAREITDESIEEIGRESCRERV